MGRSRKPLIAQPRYCVIVFGKPVSFQTGTDRKPEKSAKYASWRDNVIRQVELAIAERSGGRGFEMILDPISICLIWYSPDVGDRADPDLDNIAKPYLDAVKGRLIPDDRNVQLLRTIKVDINSELSNLPEVIAAKTSSQLEAAQEFVMVVVEPFNDEHLLSFSKDLAYE